MFHKESSSLLQQQPRGGGGGGDGTTNNNNKKKALDIPLKKSDRRRLLDRVHTYFTHFMVISSNTSTNYTTTTANTTETVSDDTVTTTTTEKKNEKEVEAVMVPPPARPPTIPLRWMEMLETTFLQGDLAVRSISLSPQQQGSHHQHHQHCKMMLYLRSPTPNDNNPTDGPSNMPATTTTRTTTTTIPPLSSDIWPYTTSTQFVWMTLEDKKGNILCESPTVALWSVLMGMITTTPTITTTMTMTTTTTTTSENNINNNNDDDDTMLYDLIMNGNGCIHVHPAVSHYICKGADLMKAGMRSLPKVTTGHHHDQQEQEKQHHPRPTTKSPAAAIMSSSRNKPFTTVLPIVVQGNSQPFAVGLLRVRSDESIGAGTKGIGVEIWNTYGDDLWRTTTTTTTAGANHSQGRKNNNNNHGYMNPIGGALFENGHYGNIGFQNGKSVLPILVNPQHNDSSDDDEDDEDNENNNNNNVDDDESAPKNDHIGVKVMSQEAEEEDDDNDGMTSRNALPIREAAESHGEEEEQTVESVEEMRHDDKATRVSSPTPLLSPDEVLHQAVLRGLLILQKKDIPMVMTTFYSNHVIPNRLPGTTIDMKSTTYKKFGIYLKEQMQRGLLQAGKDISNKKNMDPMACLLSFNKGHEDFKGIEKSDVISTLVQSKNGPLKKLVLVSLYTIPHHWVSLLRLDDDDVKGTHATSEVRRGKGMLTSSEIKTILESYLTREGLIVTNDKGKVQLDGSLSVALFKGNPNPPPEIMTRQDLFQTFLSKLGSAYALVEMPGSKIIKLSSGNPPMIEIEVSMRQSKKFVTRVRGLEDYFIDGSNFAKDVSKRLACSSSVDIEASTGRPALKKGHVECIFQGNIVTELEALLLGDESLSNHGGIKDSYYSVPKQALSIQLRKGVPTRKKR